MDLRKVVEICNAVREAGGPSLTPCLVDETAGGKTASVRALAEELGLPVFTVLLRTEQPEDLLGYPRPVDRGDGEVVIRQTPREEFLEAIERPCVIFLDELDKAHEEALSAVLTLLASREVRGRRLHPQTVVLAAMQPVPREVFLASSTGEALATRLVFLPLGDTGRKYLEGKYRIDLDGVILPVEVELPLFPSPRPRTTEWCILAALECFRAGWEEGEVIELLSGVIPRQFAELLLERIKGSDWLDPWEIAAKQGRLLEMVSKVPVGELEERLAWLAGQKWRPFCRALGRVLRESDVETASAVLRREFARANAMIKEAGGYIEPEPEMTIQEAAEILRSELEDVVQVWEEEAQAMQGNK